MLEYDKKIQEDSNDFVHDINFVNGVGLNILKDLNINVDISVYKKMIKFENCICKLKIMEGNENAYATGFFCYIPSKELRVLITNNHVINKDFLNNKKELVIYIEEDEVEKQKIIYLDANRFKFTDESLNTTVIEILDEDLIDSYIEVDEEIIKDNEFINNSVFNLQFPQGGKMKASFGKIIESANGKTQFKYNAGTEAGSSGSPIILIKGHKIIGLDKGGSNTNNINNKINLGVYLNNVIKLLPKSQENKNTIKCLYDIKSEDLNKDIKVYDNKFNFENNINSISVYKNDEMNKFIKDGKLRFYKEGKYFISYSINNSTRDLRDLFRQCKTLKRVYLPSFADIKIENMSNMLFGCISLEKINFPRSFNTENVTNMSNMLGFCESLENLNLTSFNTKNVVDMSHMFNGCESLNNVNLSSFNTENVKLMDNMFNGCHKLRDIDLSSFNTNNVTDFSSMFYDCISLRKLNLSNFNFKNASRMENMLINCKSLVELDLSSFETKDDVKTNDMFFGCKLLKKINNCTDKKILKAFESIKSN